MSGAGELILSVVTPERSILKDTAVESIVLPGSAGQFNILPGHTNFITTLKHGAFGYRVNGEWSIAFLSGGFTQVHAGKVTVLAETVEMSQELDVAKAELELSSTSGKLKGAKLGSPEYADLMEQQAFAVAKVKAAQKKLH
jgi:F-type H+-transporting ATPase subunit epsilon